MGELAPRETLNPYISETAKNSPNNVIMQKGPQRTVESNKTGLETIGRRKRKLLNEEGKGVDRNVPEGN